MNSMIQQTKNKRRKTEISLEDTLNYAAEGNELRLEDILGTEEDVVDKEFEEILDRFDDEPAISQIELSDGGEKYSVTAFLPCEDGIPELSDFLAFFDSYNTDILRFKSILSD